MSMILLQPSCETSDRSQRDCRQQAPEEDPHPTITRIAILGVAHAVILERVKAKCSGPAVSLAGNKATFNATRKCYQH
jgi:hypothetical protein